MLLGCCHCEEEPSSSVPSESSESSSSSAPATVTRTGCVPDDERCLGNTAPAIFNVHIEEAVGTKQACYYYYIGDFAVYLITTNPAICWNYQSVEYMKVRKLGLPPCSDNTSQRRWTAAIAKSGANTIITVTCVIFDSGFAVSLGIWRYTGSGDINCVTSFTCTKTSTDTTGYPFPTTVFISPI